MNINKIQDPLAGTLISYCNVNAMSIDALKEDLDQHWKDKNEVELFRQQLYDAAYHDAITLKQYEDLTDEDFDTHDDLVKWLKQLYDELFKD